MKRTLTCEKCKKVTCQSCTQIEKTEYRCKCLTCQKTKLAKLDAKVSKQKKDNC